MINTIGSFLNEIQDRVSASILSEAVPASDQNVEMSEPTSSHSKRTHRDVDKSNTTTPRSSKKQQTEDPSPTI